MRKQSIRIALASMLALVAACGEPQPITINNTPSGPRGGARGRLVGFVFDPETGAGLTDATIETFEVDKKVSAKTKDGFFVLDNLTAGLSYRVHIAAGGFATRVVSTNISQAPTDVYDAIGTGSLGNVPMARANASVRGRVEWASGGVVTKAKVLVDYSQNFLVTTSADVGSDGYYTIQNLPALPTGLSQQFCVYLANADDDQVADFNAQCQSVATYPGQTTLVTHRLTRVDLANQDVNIVSGVVRDILTREPTAGVEVFEIGKEAQKVTTDASGFFYLPSVGVNQQVRLVFRKAPYAEGYWEVLTTRGNSYGNTNMLLFPGGAKVDGRVYYQNLVPAKNAEVRIDLRTALQNIGSGTAGFNVYKTVRADEDGKFTLDGLPGWYDGLQNGSVAGSSFSQNTSGIQLYVTPWSADPDLFPETQNVASALVLYPGATTPAWIQLPSRAGITLTSNSAFNGIVGLQDPIKLLFSLPIIPADSTFFLRESSTGLNLAANVTFADANRLVTVSPVVGSGLPYWQDGRAYSLNYVVRANNGASNYLSSAVSFVARTDMQAPSALTKIPTLVYDPSEVDATTRTLTLRWPAVPDAFSYAIYAKTVNSPRVPQYLRIATWSAMASPAYTVNLGNPPFPSLFDNLQNQTFAFGQKISFLVVPMDSRGLEAAFEKGATVEVGDNMPPRLDTGIAQLDSGGNIAHDVRIRVRATEAMHPTQGPALVLPAGFTFKAWNIENDGTNQEGVIVLNGAGSGTLGLQLRDTSSNLSRALTFPILGTALVTNPSFEGSTCTAAGWSSIPSTDCSSCTTQVPPAPNAVTEVPGYLSAWDGNCSLQFGQPEVSLCGTQTMTTPLDLSGATLAGRNLSIALRYWSYANTGTQNFTCNLQDMTNPQNPTNLGQVIGMSGGGSRTWQSANFDLTPHLGKVTRLRCDWTASACHTRAGMLLDDVRVWLK